MSREKNLKINAATIKNAKDCSWKHGCLAGKRNMCEAKSALGKGFIFVKKVHKEMCSYYQPFGYSGFCSCPVRNAIFADQSK